MSNENKKKVQKVTEERSRVENWEKKFFPLKDSSEVYEKIKVGGDSDSVSVELKDSLVSLYEGLVKSNTEHFNTSTLLSEATSDDLLENFENELVVMEASKALGNFLTHNRNFKKISQLDVAAALNTTQRQISRYERGESAMSMEILAKYCDAIDLSPALRVKLINIVMNKTEKSLADVNAEKLVKIPEYNVSASAGYGDFQGFEEVIETHQIPSKFLPVVEKAQLGIIRINGDSMTPTINSGDYAVVNIQPIYVEDGIYLIRIEDAVYCKRLQRQFGSVRIISDNPVYSEMSVSRDDGANFQIIGRVLLTMKKH